MPCFDRKIIGIDRPRFYGSEREGVIPVRASYHYCKGKKRESIVLLRHGARSMPRRTEGKKSLEERGRKAMEKKKIAKVRCSLKMVGGFRTKESFSYGFFSLAHLSITFCSPPPPVNHSNDSRAEWLIEWRYPALPGRAPVLNNL